MHQPPPSPPNSSSRGLIVLFSVLGVFALVGCVYFGFVANAVYARMEELLVTTEEPMIPDPEFDRARTAQEVASRAYCNRAYLAFERVVVANEANKALPQAELALVEEAIADPTAGVTPMEREFFRTSITSNELEHNVNYSHHMLATFAWVLGHQDSLPSPIARSPRLAQVLEDPGNLKALRASAKLRPRHEIMAAAKRRQFLYYRLCYELDHRESLAPLTGERRSDDLLKDAEGFKVYPERRNGDLIVGTTTVNTLSKSLLESVADANYAQLFVLTWALGWGEEWDETVVHHRAFFPPDPLARQSR